MAGNAAREWADQLIARFGSLARVLRAQGDEITAVCGEGAEPARHLTAARAAMVQALETEVLDQPVLGSSEALSRYLFATQAHERTETLRVLLLDARNRLIREVVLARGTVDAAPLLPREIIRLCLDTGATAVILAHNHPSGDPTPSAADIAVTRRFATIARELGIELHDHVVIAAAGLTSMRAKGYL